MQNPEGDILVHNGDVIEDFDIPAIYDFHKSKNAAVTLVLVDNPPTNSVVCGENDKVISIEQGKGLTYSGVAIMNSAFLKSLPHNRFAPLKEFLEMWIEQGKIFGYRTKNFWCDYGTFGSYLQLHRKILSDGSLPFDNSGAGKYIHPTAYIHPDAVVGGFAVIGENARISSGCRIINSVVWKNTIIRSGEHINAILTPFGNIDVS